MARYINPYQATKSADSAGNQNGSGLPAKFGKRKGTFVEDSLQNQKATKAKPPRKMN